jgi:hypothetical protein
MNPSVIGALELAERFHLRLAVARALLRELPHVQIGRRRFTTEAWLAQWMAAQMKNPPPVICFDPLEQAVAERAAWLVGQMVDQGKLAVLPAAVQSSA